MATLSDRLLERYHAATGYEVPIILGLLEDTIRLVKAAEAWGKEQRAYLKATREGGTWDDHEYVRAHDDLLAALSGGDPQ